MKKVLSILIFAVLSAAPIFANGGELIGKNNPGYITPITIPASNPLSGTQIQIGVGLWEVSGLPFFFISVDRTFSATLNLYLSNETTGEFHLVKLAPGTNSISPILPDSSVTLNTPTSHIGTWKISASIGKGVSASGYVTISGSNTINTAILY